MARQVLTLPDVPSTLLTQSVAAATYLPLSHAPGTDPHTQYLTQGRGDARYSLLAHNHDAAYAPTAHNHDAAYVNATGNETMAGALTVQQDIYTKNLYLDTDAVSRWVAYRGASGTPPKWFIGTDGVEEDFFFYRWKADATGPYTGLRIMKETGAFQINGPLQCGTGHLVLDASGAGQLLLMEAQANMVGPARNNVINLGDDAHRWANVYGITGYFTGGMNCGGVTAPNMSLTAVNASIEIGQVGGAGNTPFIDFHSSVNANDFDARIICAGGAGVSGTGNLQINSGDCYFSGTMYAGQTLNSGTITCRDTIYCTNWIMSGNGAESYCWFYPGGVRHVGSAALSLGADTQNIQFAPGGGVVHPDTQGTRYLGHTSLHWAYGYFYNLLCDVGGQTMTVQSSWHLNLTSTAAWVNLKSAGHIFFDGADSNIVAPNVDNKLICGGTGNRWKYVAAVQGGINTSHADFKEKLALLDGALCARAVLETDWVSFEYKPSPDPDPEEDEEPQKWIKRRDDHRKLQDRDAFTRRQKGYVLGHGSHKVSPLFGLEDREHASPSSDLAVVACALQSALKRIAVLEEKFSV